MLSCPQLGSSLISFPAPLAGGGKSTGLSVNGIRIWPLNGFIKVWDSDIVASQPSGESTVRSSHWTPPPFQSRGRPLCWKSHSPGQNRKWHGNLPFFWFFSGAYTLCVMNRCRKFCYIIYRLIFTNPCSCGHIEVQNWPLCFYGSGFSIWCGFEKY